MSNIDCNIEVQVVSDYIDDQSEPRSNQYVFAYTIKILNQGNVAAQLISRHWIITDANGKIQEVDGDGVVGEQPYLNPGEEFSYSSGAIIETPVGSMHGIYKMIADDGITFDAPIAPFTLAVPRILN
ncbi:MAG: Co2+/Mg2+ efflux protein ApaG [Woeseia sp.]|nr:Co2+/Mg2+ efflux protein ApaG [Woeseia sp.]|tara:strand:+ start:9202 stop:9582 length:381 start_codon:yes stop_codon:yes gene_type:complete